MCTDSNRRTPVTAATGSGAIAHIWRRTFDDSEEQAGCVESLFPQRYFQVGAGRFCGEMTSINLDGVRLFRERVNRRLIQEGMMNVANISWIQGRTGLFRCNGLGLEPEGVMSYGARAEFEVVLDACELIGVAIAPEALTSHGEEAAAPSARVSGGLRFVSRVLAAPLCRAVSRALFTADVSGSAQMPCWQALRQEILSLALPIVNLPEAADLGRSRQTHARVVRSAKRAINSDLTHAAGISDLCRVIGVSRRNLFYAFDAVLGLSPHQYLKTVRLHAARHALKHLGPDKGRISDLAWDCGFSKPSQFAADYKRRFGELPSETTPCSPS